MKKKIIVASDSFKGSLSSQTINRTALSILNQLAKEYEPVLIPFADGGEGTVEAFIASGKYEAVSVQTVNAFNEPIEAIYGYNNDTKTAVIEMASAAGISQVDHLDVENASTYGVGVLMKMAILKGAHKILLGLGGSCTNDGGCGAASALGIEFINENGEVFVPTGRTLKDIVHIHQKASLLDKYGIEVTAMCDVKNPLTGPLGAAAIFGPQKGASPAQVKMLDDGLRHLAEICRSELKTDIETLPGAGAAGGMGGGSVAFFQGKLKAGVEAVMEITGFDQHAKEAVLVITGEGQLDAQSFHGKVIDGVLQHSTGIDVIAVVGQTKDIEDFTVYGLKNVYQTNPSHRPFNEIRQTAREDYSRTFTRMIQDWLNEKSV